MLKKQVRPILYKPLCIYTLLLKTNIKFTILVLEQVHFQTSVSKNSHFKTTFFTEFCIWFKDFPPMNNQEKGKRRHSVKVNGDSNAGNPHGFPGWVSRASLTLWNACIFLASFRF